MTDESVTLRAVCPTDRCWKVESKFRPKVLKAAGESIIWKSNRRNVHALPEVLAAIANADIILQPGQFVYFFDSELAR